MTIFADSSALVTRYADEPHRSVLGPAVEVVVSQLARVEVPSPIWRKHRIGELSTEDCAVLVRAFEADYFGADDATPGFAVVLVNAAVLDRAARMVAVHQLRADDAVQLASACIVAEVAPECDTFAAFDERLRAAAAAEGLKLLPAGTTS